MVIGVTFNNVDLVRAKSPRFKYGWPPASIVSWPCCVGILKDLGRRHNLGQHAVTDALLSSVILLKQDCLKVVHDRSVSHPV
jgi:hypothetical protein